MEPSTTPQHRPFPLVLNQKRIKVRRKRRDLFWWQVCWLGGMLLVVLCISSLVEKAGFYVVSYTSEAADRRIGRRLMEHNAENATVAKATSHQYKNCTEPALREFPDDVFTNEERRQGAIALHLLCTMYMFYALAIVCDDYFVPSLDKICEVVPLTWWSLIRDSTYYTLSVMALILIIYDEKVSWWESLVLILMYAVYILIMKFNTSMQIFFESKLKKTSVNMANGNANNTEMDDNSNCDATVVLLKKANFCRNSSVLMVDELLSAYPHQLSFSEASLRIMITSHFGPKTRLSMASRMLINERQRLISSKSISNGEPEVSIKMPAKHNIENGTGPSNSTERSVNGQRREVDRTEAGTERENENENEDNQNNENDEEEEEEDEGEGPYVPFHLPVGMWDVIKWAIAWPLCFMMYFTIPNCAKPRWEKYFMFTFVAATLWIAVFSYMMVWMVTIIGYTLGIPDVIMGITFLAAGTSVPDCMASLIVARQGMGDMAVSNSIGSNVFDILMGLGLPWSIKTIAVNYGSYLALNSRGLIYSVGLLLASVFVTVVGVHLNKWKLDKKLGCVSLFLYAVFLCFSIMTEFNVFTFVNLPMCRDH
uniref:sodium/potassium/calcium exchanger 3 isoform X2 n=1 Tax=Pristiophorus japonicus TaxID=55135 RepID=UPI00398EE0EB